VERLKQRNSKLLGIAIAEASNMDESLNFVGTLRTITLTLAFVSPVLTAILIGFLWFRPRRSRMPAVLPGIPLALISPLLQVFVAVYGVLKVFQELATGRLRGVRNLASSIAAVIGYFPIAIALSIGCIVALVIFQMICDRRDRETEWNEPEDRPAPRIVFILSAISALAAMALLWVFEGALDLVFLVSDSARLAEGRMRLGHMGTVEMAAMISHRLLLSSVLSLALAAAFLAAPLFLLVGEVPEWVRTQSWTLAIVTVVCLILFGVVYHNEILYMISITQR
jgi:hypothetical protein